MIENMGDMKTHWAKHTKVGVVSPYAPPGGVDNSQSPVSTPSPVSDFGLFSPLQTYHKLECLPIMCTNEGQVSVNPKSL